jgi:hypothetical protein
MRRSVSKEKAKKILRGQSSKEVEPDSKRKITLDKANQ